MKITKTQLKQIIKEEMETLVEDRDLSVYLEPLFQEGAAGNVFAEAMANNLMLDEESDFQEMIQAIKDGLNNWYSSRRAPESPQKMGHPYDYPPGEEWRHEY